MMRKGDDDEVKEQQGIIEYTRVAALIIWNT